MMRYFSSRLETLTILSLSPLSYLSYSIFPVFFMDSSSTKSPVSKPVSKPVSTQASNSKSNSAVKKTQFSPKYPSSTRVIEPLNGKSPSHAFVFLHGLGDTADGWIDVFRQISPSFQNIRFILPTANVQPVTLNGGMKMPSWYDIYSLDKSGPEDSKGIGVSVHRINSIIDDQVKSGISVENIGVGGFSQGGVVSLATSMQYLSSEKKRLACNLGLSCYLPLQDTLLSIVEKEGENLPPLLLCHGKDDTIVKYSLGRNSFNTLKSKGYSNISFNSYPGLGHSCNIFEIRDMAKFLRAHLT